MSPDEQPTLHARTRARERAEDARAARADEPAEAEDLSTAQRERDTFNYSRDCESIDPEGVILRNRSPRRKRLHEDAPEHCLDQPILRPLLDRSSRHELAFAHNGDPVTQGEHLVELVGDVDGRDPLRA